MTWTLYLYAFTLTDKSYEITSYPFPPARLPHLPAPQMRQIQLPLLRGQTPRHARSLLQPAGQNQDSAPATGPDAQGPCRPQALSSESTAIGAPSRCGTAPTGPTAPPNQKSKPPPLVPLPKSQPLTQAPQKPSASPL